MTATDSDALSVLGLRRRPLPSRPPLLSERRTPLSRGPVPPARDSSESATRSAHRGSLASFSGLRIISPPRSLPPVRPREMPRETSPCSPSSSPSFSPSRASAPAPGTTVRPPPRPRRFRDLLEAAPGVPSGALLGDEVRRSAVRALRRHPAQVPDQVRFS